MSELPKVAPGSWNGAPQGTTLGHIHLFIRDLEEAKAFYHHGLGLDLMSWRYPGALFTSAGGYHHHVGLNNCAAGSLRATEAEPRLLFWELVLPDADDVKKVLLSLQGAGYSSDDSDPSVASVTDPWGISVHLVASS